MFQISRRRHNPKWNLTEDFAGYIFMMPTILVVGTFVVLPILYAVFLSLHKVQLLGGIKYEFIGFRNFTRLVEDERVWIALRNTAEYVAIVVPTQTVLALILAVTLNSGIRGKNWWRIIYFLPTVTSSAVLTLIFMWIYNTDGLLNDFLAFVRLPTYNWLGDPAVALKGIMMMNIWSTAPFYMVIYLAALQDIPQQIYEAAELDGANGWQKFIYITIPLLQPVTFFVMAIGVIGTFQIFDQSYIFSGGTGGPNNATLTLVLFLRWLFNSVVIAVSVTLLNLLFNSMAGYALARLSFVGKSFWFFLILAILAVPAQITLIPTFLILKAIGWLNSYQGMVVPSMVNATFIFMMRQFFINFPKELEEAAQLDGLNTLGIFYHIVLPLAKPALAAQAIFVFMGSWNNFFLPVVVLFDPEMFTLPLGLNTFKGQYISYWNYIMAASMVFTLPALSIYAFFNRYFIQSVTFTGTKG